jgi:chromate transporter
MGHRVSLREVLWQWGRIGCIGFGGPPAHISLLRQLCVVEKKWMTDEYFEDAIATCNLLPGPASTQLSILCAWTVAGIPGAIIGGLAFIVPGLVAIVLLASVFLASAAPDWILAAGAGASSALAVVAFHAASSLIPTSWARARSRQRWMIYVLAGACAAMFAGSWVVVIVLACGASELLIRRGAVPLFSFAPAVALFIAVSNSSIRFTVENSLLWTAFKVGALSYGGGFVIIPLMFTDAVERFAWMTESQFLDAVVLGQITPGPVVHTVTAVGFAASGIFGALIAAVVAFGPSFVFVTVGAKHFDKIRMNVAVRSFLDGSGPAAIGAIVGVGVPLLLSLSEGWQFALTVLSVGVVFLAKRSTVQTLLAMAVIGVVVVQAGLPLPG